MSCVEGGLFGFPLPPSAGGGGGGSSRLWGGGVFSADVRSRGGLKMSGGGRKFVGGGSKLGARFA